MIYDYVDDLKKISITEYLKSRGIFPDEETKHRSRFSSPFTSDTNPSFFVYEKTNTFNDFSSGYGGDIINLVRRLENMSFKDALVHLSESEFLPIKKKFISKEKDYSIYKGFDYTRYRVNNFPDEISVRDYARKRNITSEFQPSFFRRKVGEEWIDVLAMGFIHQDEDLDVCGIKFRIIDPLDKQRFSARGRMCYYVLENILEGLKPILYITESETSSNSLFTVLKNAGRSFVIICIGGSTNYPTRIPDKYSNIKDRRVIIDYDGGNNGYKEKTNILSDFGDPVKIELEKGEDINSLHCEGREDFILNKCYGEQEI